jgi:hypothetical protein
MSALPKVETIKFNLTLDELSKDIKYRAFSNKEHKLVLEAIEMHDEGTLLNTMLDIVTACTFNSIDVQKIPTHLTDYIYLQIHLKSTGKEQMASYTCGNVIDGVKCPGEFQLRLPLDKARIVYPESYTKSRIVWVDEKKGIGIKMKSPSFEELKKVDLSKDLLNVTDHFIMTCIESVFTKDSVLVPGIDFSVEDCIEWFDELDGSTLRAVAAFFKEMPYVGLSLPVTCPICRRKEDLELKGIQDFFA